MDPDAPIPAATDGEIAAINLDGARRRAWAQFARDPRRLGLAEAILDMENLAAQFLGDLGALDRLEALAEQLAHAEHTPRVELIRAAVASAGHRFTDARDHLAQAARIDAPCDAIERQILAIDQACGMDLEEVLAIRRSISGASGRLEDLVPLGALLADLEHFNEADTIYRQAFDSYNDVSPFPLAWVCFQLGMLWGELVPEPDLDRAAHWYERALFYLPRYVHARIHLAEIRASQGRAAEAETLLRPALSSGDPEAAWRLAEVLATQGRFEEAETYLNTARSIFDRLVAVHPLAYADHAAAFYAGSGGDCRRALELARCNAENRPTRRALGQVDAIAEPGYFSDLHKPMPSEHQRYSAGISVGGCRVHPAGQSGTGHNWAGRSVLRHKRPAALGLAG